MVEDGGGEEKEEGELRMGEEGVCIKDGGEKESKRGG